MSRGRAIVIVTAVLAGTGASGAGQSPQFRSDVHTVPIYATVSDRDGRLVTGLTRDDFEVLDNGVPQPLVTFANDVQPITVVMMLDRSGSVETLYPLIEQAAAEFVRRMGPGDRARIGSFSERVQIDPAAFTGDRETLLGILRNDLQSIGPTPLWNATAAAMTALASQVGRRVVLVLTDGRDAPLSARPNVTFAELRARAEHEDVMVYGIGLVQDCAATDDPQHALPQLGRTTEPRLEAQRRVGVQRGRGRSGGRIRLPVPLPLPLPGRGVPPRPPRIFEPKNAGESGCDDSRPDPNLRALTEVGGGGYAELRPSDDLGAVFARVAEELHHQYLLAFLAPVADGAAHRLDVRVRRPGLTVRARRTYIAPKPPAI